MVEKTIELEIPSLTNPVPRKKQTIDELVDNIRDKFKGLKVGSMGDRKALKEKLTRWRIENPSITAKEILEAVDTYIESQSNLNYIQRADYFIYKKIGGVESSRLSIYIDEIKLPKENSDWATEIT